MLGAAAQATDHLPLMTYVTCPIRRYHPAVVARKDGTVTYRGKHFGVESAKVWPAGGGVSACPVEVRSAAWRGGDGG